MGLDIRWPIGAIFTIYGALLIAYSKTADPAILAPMSGGQVDLQWGAAMLVFGLVMAALAYRATRKNLL
jgi:steroid 5-alpha reductase family enzyme